MNVRLRTFDGRFVREAQKFWFFVWVSLNGLRPLQRGKWNLVLRGTKRKEKRNVFVSFLLLYEIESDECCEADDFVWAKCN